MSVLDLSWLDIKRLLGALVLSEEGRKPPWDQVKAELEKVAREAAEAGAKAASTGGTPFSGFSNPPSPHAAQRELRIYIERVRQALVDEHGQAYADEVWGKLRK